MKSHGRRRFLTVAGAAIASAACGAIDAQTSRGGTSRLTARVPPGARTAPAFTGEERLGLSTLRDGVLQIPAAAAAGPVPLLVLLHGAGGSGERQLRRLGQAPGAAGLAVLAPDSRGGTWDAIRGTFGPDVRFLDDALAFTFGRVSIDPRRVAVGGFSDGASYALSLGLMNGDLFGRIAAFSPGFVRDGTPAGAPRIFISHGVADTILPIDPCSRTIVPALRARQYDVTYREFDGGHEVPPAIASEAMKWIGDQ